MSVRPKREQPQAVNVTLLRIDRGWQFEVRVYATTVLLFVAAPCSVYNSLIEATNAAAKWISEEL
jgi:hypothetical protein